MYYHNIIYVILNIVNVIKSKHANLATFKIALVGIRVKPDFNRYFTLSIRVNEILKTISRNDKRRER